MGNDWCELTLEESMDAIIDYRGKTPKKTDSGIPLITAKIIKSGRIETVNEFISEDDYDTWMRRGIPNEGDVVMTTEAPLGEIAQLDGRKIALAQRVITLRGKKDILDNTFLKYLMISEYVQHQLDGRGTGTTVKGIKQSELRKVMLKFPSFTEQKAIAHILGSLDDKIELNRQMNETLEAMAQALFKSWFVDFDPVIDNALAAGNAIPDEWLERAEQRQAIEKKDHSDIQDLFPDEFECTEEMGWIPKGWGVKKISDLVESVSITYPLKTVNEVIFLNTGDILAGKLLHKNYSDASSLPGQAKKSIKRDDILYSEIRPKNKRYAYVNFEADDYVVSTKLMVLRSVSSVKSLFSYFYLKQESVVLDLQYMAEDRSGTFPQITFDVLSQLTLTLPNETALVDYFTDQVLVPYHNKIYKNEESSEKLAEFRDTLLPKLMSGELRIADAAEMVEDV